MFPAQDALPRGGLNLKEEPLLPAGLGSALASWTPAPRRRGKRSDSTLCARVGRFRTASAQLAELLEPGAERALTLDGPSRPTRPAAVRPPEDVGRAGAGLLPLLRAVPADF
ncbi:hypothetical protein P7K49_009463 [Saguinus oedipus]|uniref:Uncharacterized protein n=1 Tax=Saguinus oedipus TaxID=9490 RepID=A0ABQ9VN66_SAGOE|nr:hypothetical protein P7K49_009463 [Saguinus oedipus]